MRQVPNLVHISEFSKGSNGEQIKGTCTEASAAMILTAANGLANDYQSVVDLMISIRDVMFQAGTASANGAATFANIASDLRRRGADIDTQWDYQGDSLPQDWVGYLRANAGIKPIMVQLANAQALVNVSGTDQDVGVHYHALTILGVTDTGYIVGDPNNPNVVNDTDIYPLWALENASVCALIALNVKAQPQEVTPMATVATVPDGWHDDGIDTLTAPSGCIVIGGFREYIVNHSWDAADQPRVNVQSFGDTRRQDFNFSVLYANVATHALWLAGGNTEMQRRLEDSVTANQQIVQLQAELDALKATPAQTAPIPVADKQAQEAAAALAVLVTYIKGVVK